ncbi:hypothetical protein NL676_021401 [Syzygium grande]|nr:hypothetical protein NL676_021401 [Syzygium grande]
MGRIGASMLPGRTIGGRTIQPAAPLSPCAAVDDRCRTAPRARSGRGGGSPLHVRRGPALPSCLPTCPPSPGALDIAVHAFGLPA